jgi:predicted peptidase
MEYFYILLLSLIIHTSLFAQLDPFETTVTRNEKMNFYLYSPTLATELSPLVVFLHGGGESGDDIQLVKKTRLYL